MNRLLGLPNIPRGRRPNFQSVAVPNRALAREVRHLEILRQFQAIRGASVFAEATKHAARSVIRKSGEDFAASGVVAMPSDDDQILRAGQRAKIARNAQRFARFRIHVKARRAAETLGNHRPLKRILLGVNFLGVLVAERQPHSLQEIHHENAPKEFSHAGCSFVWGAKIVKHHAHTANFFSPREY